MKRIVYIAGCVLALSATLVVMAAPQDMSPASADPYRVDVYKGPMYSLKGYVHDAKSGWRDEEGKTVEPPHVNFAGRFYVAAHSCGAGCRYYSMSDMKTGEEYSALRMFDSMDPPPRTKEGYPYMTELLTHAESRMFVARYHIDGLGKELCREKVFLLQQNNELIPVGGTRMICGV